MGEACKRFYFCSQLHWNSLIILPSYLAHSSMCDASQFCIRIWCTPLQHLGPWPMNKRTNEQIDRYGTHIVPSWMRESVLGKTDLYTVFLTVEISERIWFAGNHILLESVFPKNMPSRRHLNLSSTKTHFLTVASRSTVLNSRNLPYNIFFWANPLPPHCGRRIWMPP